MIRVELNKIKQISSELVTQSKEAAALQQQLSELTHEISRQSFTEETVSRLIMLSNRLEESRRDMDKLRTCLEEIVCMYECTECEIKDAYEQEKIIYRRPEVGQNQVLIHPRLEKIVRIEL